MLSIGFTGQKNLHKHSTVYLWLKASLLIRMIIPFME